MTSVFAFDNTYVRELDGFYAAQGAAVVDQPSLLFINRALAAQLGVALDGVSDDQLARIFSGSELPAGAEPIAQVYAGHQFGGFSPQLGDGRALLLGEVVDGEGARWDIQLKGSGTTPFSRGGDGKAPLGPVLREYLMAEAMHALGVATTRALAAVSTNGFVYREGPQPAAVLTRVASSHVRIGTFQFFAAKGESERTRQLADYVIARHYPELGDSEQPYLDLLDAVILRQARLVAHWMSIGFVHGVMNTDNMAIAGETIDYGPCAFMDTFDRSTVFSSIDRHGRYAYGNQPGIAQWNLARFAETLVPLLADESDAAVELATASVVGFREVYLEAWIGLMRAKLGLTAEAGDQGKDQTLVEDLMSALEHQSIDWTRFFVALADAAEHQRLESVAKVVDPGSELERWLKAWQERSALEPSSGPERAHQMRAVNPIYIPRNHLVEEALDDAVQADDYSSFEKLRDVLAHPFEQREGLDRFTLGAPAGTVHRTFCGT